MRCLVLLILTVGLLIAADTPAKDSPDQDMKKLEGTWGMVYGERDGQPETAKTVKNSQLTIIDNRHVVIVGDRAYKGTHNVDPSKNPKVINALDDEGPFKGKAAPGIYELTGDELKVCFAAPGQDRPTEFTTKSGTGQIYHVWKRQKK